MSEEKKYIERWICKSQCGGKRLDLIFDSEAPGTTHVIEYSAYEDLEKKLEIAKEALESIALPCDTKNATLVKMLEVIKNDTDIAKQARKEIEW